MNDEINHIWKEHHDQLLDFIRKRTKDPVEAEDILQEVFLKILDKIDSLKDSEKLKSWMYQIARNTIIDHFRLQKKEDKQLHYVTSEGDEPEDNSSMKEAESWIGLYIDGLPENYKEAVVLSELNGLSIGEVAEKLNISYTNARARVHRGRQALKKSLTDCCTFHVDVYGNIIDYHRNAPVCKKC
ncbi:RNA polymerase sigma factor SigZ [Maribellus sediminis]|uniref:RNA polymerase sigma factor SigZ n=1 Tax=Maribellus sediminis TaxID=2696285 RepID=UPI001430478F|nr:RNA polymerase sigma factor SigZ [Maribellus sediminis]